MAHKKLQATAELFLNTKNAKKDAQIFIDDLKQKLTDIESAADKMTVFKDMVEYIAQVDKALAALRANNKDAFNNMFDGLDANLKKQLESIFGVDGLKLGQLDVLKDTLNNLTTKSSIKEIREFAKSLNEIYESVGAKAPFDDIENKFKEFSKEAKTKHIAILSDQLANFATVWKNVNSQLSKGLGIGGNGFGAISGLSQEVQNEIDKLKEQEKEVKEILETINNPKNAKVSLAQQPDEQVEQLKALKDAFIAAESAKKQFETNKMTGTPEYLNAVAEYIKAAANVKSAFESTKLKKSGNEWIMSSGLGTLQDVDNILDNFFVQNKDLMDKVVNMYRDKIYDIGAQISFLEKPYDTLKNKLEEYAELQNKMNHEDRFSDDEIDAIDEKIQKLEKYLLSLDKVGDKKNNLKKILTSVTFDGMDGLSAAEGFCRFLGIEIPEAAQKAEDALKTVVSSNTNDVSTVIGSNADEIVDDTKKIVSAIDYAKKELITAWQEYYRAAQQAADDYGMIIEDGETSPEMDKIKASIDKKIEAMGATATNPSKWGVKVDLDLSDAIADGDIDADDIEREIDKLIKQHGISFNIPVENITTPLDAIEENVEQGADTVVDTIELAKQKIVNAFKIYYRAIQEAKSLGIDTTDTDHLPDNIESMYGSMQDMFDKFGLLKKQKVAFNGKIQSINYDEIDFDEIEDMVNNLVDFFNFAGSPLQITADASDIIAYDTFDNISKAGNVITKEFSEATDTLDVTENEVVDVQTAFQNLINYISQSGIKPSKFFHKLESGAQSVDDELESILQSLNLIDSSGNINLSSINSGFTNKGGFVSDQYTMIARRITGQYGQDYLGKSEKLQAKLANAKQSGAQIGAIFDLIKDEAHGLFYEIQNTVPGTAAFSHHKMDVNADVLNASKDQLSDLVHTIKSLSENGLFIDFGGDNILYDKDKGFSIIDLGLVGDQYHTVSSQNTLQENIDRFIQEYFKFAPSNMHADIQTMLADTLYDIAQGVDSSVVNPNGPSKQKQVSSNYNRQIISATKAEEAAHEQNTDAIDDEKAALEALIALKEKAQNMKWKDFAKDESLTGLKETAGFTSVSQLEKFWKKARYDKQIDFYEISKSEAEKIFNTKLTQGLASDWYTGAKFPAKDQLENEILQDDEIRNAALNYMYYLYQNHLPSQYKQPGVKSFSDFLDTEFTLYRGDYAPLIYGDESKLSFSWSEEKAKDFGNNVGTIKLKPKNTIGNAGSGFTSEVETFGSYMGDTSWFKTTNESFEDFYSKQTKEMQDEINAGLVNLEKRRIQDLLDENISKLVHKAGKDSEFQNGILKQFQQGYIPKSFDVAGDGSIADKFAEAYNGLSEIDKKLVAYYATLEAISKSLPNQFSMMTKSEVGHDANLFNAVLNDPSGVQKHVTKLTGESKFGILGQNAQDINVEANMHKLNAQAMEEEKQKQEQLNQEKQKSIQAYYDVTNKLASDMSWEKDVPDVWNQLSDILHHVQSVAGSSDNSTLIGDGGYLDNITGELLQVKKLIQTIDDLMGNTGIDLSYVQDYLAEIYKNADLDALDSDLGQVVQPTYADVSDLLHKLNNQASDMHQTNKLADLLNKVQDVGTTPADVLSAGMFVDVWEGDMVPIDEIYKLINDLETQYGENLQLVTDYLNNAIKQAAAQGDQLNYQDVSDNLQRLVNSKQGGSDEFNMLAHVWHQLKHVDWTAQNGALDEDINNGKYYSTFNGEFKNVSDLYAFIDDIKDKWGTDLIEVKEYLNQVFAKYKENLQEGYKLDEDLLDLDDDDLLLDLDDFQAEDSDSYKKAKNKVLNELFNTNEIVKLEKLYQLEGHLEDMKTTDQSFIDSGYIQKSVEGEIATIDTVYALIEDIQNQYSTDLSDVKQCLDEVFSTYNGSTSDFAKQSKDVKSKLLDIMSKKDIYTQESELNDFTNLFDKIDGLSQSLYINYEDGKYLPEYANDEQSVTDILDLIKDLEAKYGENLDYVKTYLQTAFNTTDLDSFYKKEPIDYLDVKEKLFNEYLEATDIYIEEKLKLLLSSISDVHLTDDNLIKEGKVDDLLDPNGLSYNVEEIYGLIEGIQKQHGLNLEYIKDYLDQLYESYNNQKLPEKLFNEEDLDLSDDVKTPEFQSKTYSVEDYENIYKSQTDNAQEAVNEMAAFFQRYQKLTDKIYDYEPIDFLISPDNATPAEITEVQQTLEELRKKKKEIAKLPIVQIEDDVAKIQELQAEVLNLQNKLKSAKLNNGRNISDYSETFDLSIWAASLLKSVVEGQNIYDLENSLATEYNEKVDKMYDAISEEFAVMIAEDASHSLNEYLLKLGEELKLEQQITGEKEQQKILDEEKNVVKTRSTKESTKTSVIDSPEDKINIDAGKVVNGDYALESTLQQTNSILGNILSATKSDGSIIQHSKDQAYEQIQDAPVENLFAKNIYNQKKAFNEYRNNLQDVDYLTESLRTELDELGIDLQQVIDQPGLDEWNKKFIALKDNIQEVKSVFDQMNLGVVNLFQKELTSGFNKLTMPQKEEMLQKYLEAIVLLNKQKQAVKDGHAVELAGIKQITAALQEKIDAQIKANKTAKDAEKTQKKNANFGSTASINATAKYNSLSKIAGSDQFLNSSEVSNILSQYTQAYQDMIDRRDKLRGSDDISDDDKEEFKKLTTECNEYAKALDKLIKSTLKLKSNKANQDDYMLGDDFDYSNIESRKAALTEFAKRIYDVDVSAENFKDNWNEVVFAVDNGDGTFTQMTATFTDARNEIVAMAGDTKKVQGALANFWDELQGKFKSIGAYLVASFSFHEIWSVIRQGIQYVREIDSALTELKKVTDETDASYAQFLQDMSKTGSVIGATVADLTTMASDWARLGYSIEEAGKLAESTAILLNVSEFDDATKASEALISTMQAFQYTADESQHVVDVLNEVGNNYAVSSDGIATALQDSASALMEAGNNLEQSVALVAAANKVVQDPNSVGSALRTISLRLRGTSVEVLEEIGEETDGVVESVSKMQEKIQALTGVNILTDNGAYKETYQILYEIGQVWKDMSDIDQAALLELMAGKNRANTLAAILGNMEDLEGAYESALNAEGSALKENEAYLNSIQGRIDLFNNAVQTMWMNLLDTSAIKGIVDIGTFLIKQLDTLYGKIIAIAGVLVIYKKFKDEKAFSDMFAGAVETVKELYSSIKTMVTATGEATKADIARALASKGLTSSLKEQIIAEAGLKGVKNALTAEQIKATAKILTEKFATDQLTASQYLAAMSTMGLKTALQALGNILLKNPFYLIAAGAVAAALALDGFTTTAQEAADEAEKAFGDVQSVVESTKSTIQELESELTTIQDKIDELDGKNLSFAEDQELEKLKKQREELEHSLRVQEQLLKLQQESSNKQAIASMKAYTKAASQGAEETQEAAKAWGKIIGIVGGVAVGVATGGVALAPIAVGALAGGVLGDKVGEFAGSGVTSNQGTYDSWYETYTKALETARKEEQKALKEYQKDSSNIDKLDKWQDAQQKTSDIETEMYNHLSKMQQYMSTLEYGVSDEINAELDTWNNFLDKLSIDQGASGAEVTALDRIFGENASGEIQTIKEQITDAINAGKDFDFVDAINGSQELKNTLDYVGLSAEDVKNYFTQIGETASNIAKDVTPVATYSKLSEDAEAYKETLLQTSEIIVNNTKVTEEYKESLIALVGSEAEVNKYFDENNKLIVKDAKGLNNLVKATKKNTAANVSFAKSQARLQYYELFKKMQSYIKAEGKVVAGKKNEILALYQEMNALEKTITKYARLEAQLLDTGNAYDEFEKAQEADSATDYIGSVEGWITALGEAFNTAELGTETAQTAIAGLVPESVYEDLDTVDEKMAAIFDYFKNGKLAQYFDIQFDEDGNIESAEMKLGNLRKFIEDGLANGTFVGSDWQHFDLSEDIDSLDKFKDAMGVTKEVAFAFIDSIEDHDIEWLNGDYSSLFEDILPDNLANDIYENTSALADLAVQLANGEITAEEYTKKWNELSKASEVNAQKARENASAWIETSNDVDEAKTRVQTLSDELDDLYEQGASDFVIQMKRDELEEANKTLTDTVEKMSELETLDPVVLQVALDQVQEEIEDFENNNIELLAKVKIVQDTESGEYSYEVNDGEALNENETKQLNDYIVDVNDKYSYENALGDEVIPYEDQLQNIEEILQNIYDKISGRNQDETKKSSDADKSINSIEPDGIEIDALSKLKEFFTQTIPQEWNEFWNNVGTFLAGVGEQANSLKEKIVSFFTETVANFVTETIPNAFDHAFEIIKTFFMETIPDQIEEVKTSVSEFFSTTFPEAWADFWAGISDGVLGLIDSATNGLDKFAGAVDDFFDNTMPKAWNDFWSSVEDFLFEIIPYTIGYIEGASDRFWHETVPNAFNAFVTDIEQGWEKFVSDTKTFLHDAWESLKTSAGDAWESLKEGWNELAESIDTFIDETWPTIVENVKTYLDDLWSDFKDACWNIVHNVQEFLLVTWPGIKDDIKQYFKDLFETAETEIGNIVSGVLEFINITVPEKIEDMKTSIGDFLSGIVTSVGDFLTNILTWLPNKIVEIWTNFKAGFSAGQSGGEYNPGTSGPQNVNGTAHARGTAHKSGDWGLPQSEHNSLVGELGPEMVVDPSTGRYYTVGDNGAEMVDLPKGAIIFNHKQTEGLLSNGRIASRGKAYAEGNAHSVTIWPDASSKTQWEGTGYSGPDDPTWDAYEALSDAADSLSDAADDISDASDEFRETFDWIEVRLEEINEKLSLKGAQLENAIGSSDQNAIIDDMIALNQKLYDNLIAGANKYYAYSQKLLAKVPEEYRSAAQDGTIAIEDFVGEADEKTIEAIQNYREWVQKGADATQQAEEVITEIRSLAKQQFDNVAQEYDNKISFHDSEIDQLDAHNSLLETDKGFASESIYNAIIGENESKIALLEAQRKDLKAELAGIEVGTQDWYDAVNAIMAVDTEIINLKTDIEDTQDSINELHWEKFELLMTQFEAITNEADNLIDILSTKDAVNELGEWTDEGTTSLGLYAQKMEVAEKQVSNYAEQITYLENNWKKLGYTQSEYIEKLEELKDGQYGAIKSYNDCKDAIVDLNKERVDAIKKGIDKEIEAYEKLIETRKKDLDSQKDSHDFQKNIQDQTKNIADLERKIAALSGDTSGSARAQRAKLEEELYKAQAELEETYYDRSIENQQSALDESLESFQEEKDKEIEGWEKYLENIEVVVADSLDAVRENTSAVLTTLQEMQTHYGLMVTDALMSPWKAGENAIQIYGERLNISLTQLASIFGLTVDQFAAKLGITTEQLVASLNITVGQVAETLGLTNEQMAAKLGLTMAEYSAMADGTIQQLAANMGITLPELADKLGTTTAGLVGNLDMTMAQFANAIGLSVEELSDKFGITTRELASMLGQTYQELTNPFGLSMSATVDELEDLKKKYQSILDEIERESNITVGNVNKNIDDIKKEEHKKEEPKKEEPKKESTKQQAPARTDKDYYGVALAIWNGNYGWGTGTTRFNNLKAKGFDPNKVQQIVNQLGKDGYVHSGAWVGKYHGIKDLAPYHLNKFAKGTTGAKKDQWAIIDELGDELQLVPGINGRLEYIKKGTGIIPADATSNLMSWSELNPQDMLDRNRPAISAPHVVSNEINIDCSVGTMVHIEHCDQNTLPDVEKLVNKAFDKHMQTLNNSIRSKVR